jgi:hypothetical protein
VCKANELNKEERNLCHCSKNKQVGEVQILDTLWVLQDTVIQQRKVLSPLWSFTSEMVKTIMKLCPINNKLIGTLFGTYQVSRFIKKIIVSNMHWNWGVQPWNKLVQCLLLMTQFFWGIWTKRQLRKLVSIILLMRDWSAEIGFSIM